MYKKQILNTTVPELNQNPIFSGLFLGGSGQFISSSGFEETFQTQNELRVFFVSSGKGIFRRKNHSYVVQQNDIFFSPRSEIDTFHTDLQTSVEMWWIDIYGSSIKYLLKELEISSTQPIVSGISNALFLQEFRSIVMHSGEMSLGDNLAVIGGLYKIFGMLFDVNNSSQWVRVPFDNPKILYTGTWTPWPSPFNDNQQEKYTSTAKSYAEYNFFGKGIKWFGTMNFDCGEADVIIDGNYVETIDTYSPVRLTNQLLYVNTKLSNSHHIIKIFCTGKKNDKATNCDVVVESFQYLTNNFNSTTSMSKENSYSQMTHQALELIKSHYAEDLSISQLAEQVGVSRSYFTSRFTADVGKSPSRFLAEVRLEKSKVMLIETSLNIADIALAVGYEDSAYFSNLFRKKENITPSQFRELHQK